MKPLPPKFGPPPSEPPPMPPGQSPTDGNIPVSIPFLPKSGDVPPPESQTNNLSTSTKPLPLPQTGLRELGEPPKSQQLITISKQQPSFTFISDMHLKPSQYHYGLGMDHREDEIGPKGERYNAISDSIFLLAYKSGISPGRFKAMGLAGLIIEKEALLKQQEQDQPLSNENDPRLPGRLHSATFGGRVPERDTSSIGEGYATKVLNVFDSKNELHLHPYDKVARQCQALLLYSVLNDNPILFHLDDIDNLGDIVSGKVTYEDNPSVTSCELIFVRENWGVQLKSLPVMNFTGDKPNYETIHFVQKKFDESSVKFFRHGIEVPSPFDSKE